MQLISRKKVTQGCGVSYLPTPTKKGQAAKREDSEDETGEAAMTSKLTSARDLTNELIQTLCQVTPIPAKKYCDDAEYLIDKRLKEAIIEGRRQGLEMAAVIMDAAELERHPYEWRDLSDFADTFRTLDPKKMEEE